MTNTPASPQYDLILASASPRRRELLTQIGVRFSVITHEIDESVLSGERPVDYVRRLAREKARSVLAHAGGLPVLGADTIVVCEGHILGKPRDRNDALRMLALLSGRSHQVFTAVALAAAGELMETISESSVRFRQLSAEECAQYWNSGESEGKAGAYAVQGLAAVFVEGISGSYSGIVGLPLYETYQLLQQCGVQNNVDGGIGMSEEILINVTPMETRVALIENGLLQEIFIERHNKSGQVGDIYLGKVVRVMPGMEAAFVDIGLERTAFIHSADIAAITPEGFETREEPATPIQSLLREGQLIVVQVAKDPIGTKGARLTTHLTLPSRNLVYLPRNKTIALSQRLENEDERQRLQVLIQECLKKEELEGRGGFIIRTAAEGAGENELIEEIRFLKRLWAAVERRIDTSQHVRVLYEDVPLYMRAMRDLITPQIEKIRVDTQAAYTEILSFLEDFVPEFSNNIEFYCGERPVFDLYGIDDEIDKALGRQVKLKSGGDLIIDQTEAMTTVDVNTGGFLGSRTHAETILKTNLEAATAIARQLRVRNLGGIIILDFIDMADPEHQRQVLRTLTRALEKDYARTTISEITELGLVEMTRRRTRESLGQVLCSQCPVCKGRGSLKTAETICYEIFREILRVARAYENDVLLVMASQQVVDRLLDEESSTLADLEELIGKTVRFQVEPMYTQEQYDVVLY